MPTLRAADSCSACASAASACSSINFFCAVGPAASIAFGAVATCALAASTASCSASYTFGSAFAAFAASRRSFSSARMRPIVDVPLDAVSIAWPSSLATWFTRLMRSIAASRCGESGLTVASARAASMTSAWRWGQSPESCSRWPADASITGAMELTSCSARSTSAPRCTGVSNDATGA